MATPETLGLSKAVPQCPVTNVTGVGRPGVGGWGVMLGFQLKQRVLTVSTSEMAPPMSLLQVGGEVGTASRSSASETPAALCSVPS